MEHEAGATREVAQDDFNEQVLQHLTGDRRDAAVRDLRNYLAKFDGRFFEQLADPDPFTITAADLVAVTALSVTVPPAVAAHLLGPARPQVSALLRRIPEGATITDDADHLDRDGAAWELYELLDAYHGMGDTKVSKLMAAKRPDLVPIRDTVVSAALGNPKTWWAPWREFMADDGATSRLDLVRDVAAEAGASHLSLLRVLDITIWMQHSRDTDPAGDV